MYTYVFLERERGTTFIYFFQSEKIWFCPQSFIKIFHGFKNKILAENLQFHSMSPLRHDSILIVITNAMVTWRCGLRKEDAGKKIRREKEREMKRIFREKEGKKERDEKKKYLRPRR